MGGGNDMEVEAINAANADVGDHVVISFDTSSLLKATFLLYVFPILCLLAGALIGQELAPRFQMDPSGASAGFGFLLFFISVFIVRLTGNRMSRQHAYQPKIIRIKSRAAASSA